MALMSWNLLPEWVVKGQSGYLRASDFGSQFPETWLILWPEGDLKPAQFRFLPIIYIRSLPIASSAVRLLYLYCV